MTWGTTRKRRIIILLEIWIHRYSLPQEHKRKMPWHVLDRQARIWDDTSTSRMGVCILCLVLESAILFGLLRHVVCLCIEMTHLSRLVYSVWVVLWSLLGWWMNSVVYLIYMYEGRFFMYGCNHLSTNCDIFSVMLSQLETMGRIRWFVEFAPRLW